LHFSSSLPPRWRQKKGRGLGFFFVAIAIVDAERHYAAF
jgi:hypothetical protein